MFCCEAVGGVSGNVLLEMSKRLDVGNWSILNWTLGVLSFLFRLECIICLFISSLFWFWLMCLTLLKSCCRCGIYYVLLRIVVHLKVLGGQLVLMVQVIVRVFLQNYMDFLEKKMRVDEWGSEYLWVLFDFLGTSLVGTGVGVVD